MDQLTSRQISEWEAYDRIDPIGSWRDDFRIAKVESLITNIVQQLYAKKGSKPVTTTVVDFMPDWDNSRDTEPKKQSVDEMKNILLGLADKQNKREDKRSKPPVVKTNRR